MENFGDSYIHKNSSAGMHSEALLTILLLLDGSIE
jgi:hypothetical protein